MPDTGWVTIVIRPTAPPPRRPEEDGKAAADEERDRHKKTKKREDPAPPSEAEFRLQRLRARVMQKAEQAMDDRTPGKDGDLSSM